jgi:hypothetical protein
VVFYSRLFHTGFDNVGNTVVHCIHCTDADNFLGINMNIANNMSELAKMAMVTPGLTLRVDSASQSAQIQQIMIANGATWWKHGTEILDTTLPYIGCVGIDRVELVEPGDDRIFMYTQGEQASEWGKLDLTAQAVLHNSDTIMLKTELDALQSMDSKVTTPMQVSCPSPRRRLPTTPITRFAWKLNPKLTSKLEPTAN